MQMHINEVLAPFNDLLAASRSTYMLLQQHSQGSGGSSTPDWILASIDGMAVDGERLTDDSPAVSHGGGGIDWLAQAIHPNSSTGPSATKGACLPSVASRIWRPLL